MDESRRSPIPTLLTIAALIGGGIYLAGNFKIKGLDQVSILPRDEAAVDSDEALGFASDSSFFASPSSYVGRPASAVSNLKTTNPRDYSNLRMLSWALTGFGATKLEDDSARRNLVRIVRQHDVIALQQIQAVERDLVPRLTDIVNEGGRHYDYAMGSTGSLGHQSEQLAVLFDTRRVQIDRTQTYTVSDPNNRMTHDPLVVWFRTLGPNQKEAWTFSLVNVRINLSRAAAEVALLPGILNSVRRDGRGEDDVVMAGLFQADDRYLIPRILGNDTVATVRSAATDIFGRHQTCNIVMDRNHTSEFLGRGGPIDFLRQYNLSLSEAEAVSSHLPIRAEFSSVEGGL